MVTGAQPAETDMMKPSLRAAWLLSLMVGLGAACTPTPNPTALNVQTTAPEFVKACALAVACPVTPSPLGFVSVSECIWTNQKQARSQFPSLVSGTQTFLPTALLKCVNQSTSCEDTRACFENRPFGCLQNGKGEAECALASGTACFVGIDDRPYCGTGLCDTDVDTFEGCQGDNAELCYHGVGLSIDCKALGLVCSTAGCVADGPSCEVGEERCAGDSLIVCDRNLERTIDCAQTPIPGTCAEGDCVPARGLECDPLTFVDRCDGNSLAFCDGKRRSFDCVGAGFSACSTVDLAATCVR
jgi:hypothetical protein